MVTTTHDLNTAITSLASSVEGSVRTPDSDGYDQDRTGFQLREPHEPSVVVEVADKRDVRTAIKFAASRDMRVAVQATGHGRNSAMRGGVLINTRRMSGVEVDPLERTAWVASGANWQHVIEAAAPYGLAPLSGSLPGVGAVSYTLGGGIGLLARRYGFAADHVHRLDVVTTDGQLRQVTATDEPDLFWAARGGGGNFGVVTGMEIALMPVDRLYGGGVFFDVDEVPDVLTRWRDWTATVPEEMTSAVTMLPFPDLPSVPEPLRGRHIAQLQISYAGTADQGRQLVEPLRALGPILRETLGELPYSESSTVFDEPNQASAYQGTTVLLDELDPHALSTLTHQAGQSAWASCVVGIRHLGGALARPPRIPNAVGHRDAAYSVGVLSLLEAGDGNRVRALQENALASFAPHVVGRSLNFTFDALEPERVRKAFDPADYQRLAQLKSQHDPDVMLHVNHPILPEPAEH